MSEAREFNSLKNSSGGPYINRLRETIPDPFRDTKSQGPSQLKPDSSMTPSTSISPNSYYLFSVKLVPVEQPSRFPTYQSFGFLLKHDIEQPFEFTVYLRSKDLSQKEYWYDAKAEFIRLGHLELSDSQIQKIKKCHCQLYQPFSKDVIEKNLQMNTDLPMFLVVPLNDVTGNITSAMNWNVIDNVAAYPISDLSNSLPTLLHYIQNQTSSSKIPLNEIVVRADYDYGTKLNTVFYSVENIRRDLNPNSQKMDVAGQKSQIEWLKTQHNIKLSDKSQPLVDCYKFNPIPHTVIRPQIEFGKDRYIPSIEQIVPETCRVQPIPKKYVTQFPDIVSIIWGLQNLLVVQRLQKQMPVKVPLEILDEAMTFRFVSEWRNYEQVEFLGYTIMKFLSADYTFAKFPDYEEGKMTNQSEQFVNNKALARLAEDHNMIQYAQTKRFDFHNYLPPCFNSENPDRGFADEDQREWRNRDFGDLVQAVVGASFLLGGEEGGLDSSLKTIKWLGSEIVSAKFIEDKRDYKLNFDSTTIPEHYLEKIRDFETQIGYEFKNKLYGALALGQGSSDKRLFDQAKVIEFLGDAVLEVIAGRKIYYSLQRGTPGDLSFQKAFLVNNDSLSQSGHKKHFEDLIIDPSFSTQQKVQKLKHEFELPEIQHAYRENILPYKSAAEQEKDKIAGITDEDDFDNHRVDRDFPKLFGDFFESAVGAVYLDSDRDLYVVYEAFGDLIFPQTKEALAIDCEFVGIGKEGEFNQLARVSVVDWNGKTVLDQFVKPVEKVVDWRTDVSGIRPEDVVNGHEFSEVQETIAKMIWNKLLIGHSIMSDLKVLRVFHPRYLIRDTSQFDQFLPSGPPLSLRYLVKKYLGREIQSGEHSSVVDAASCMNLYKKYMAKQLRDIDDYSELKTFN